MIDSYQEAVRAVAAHEETSYLTASDGAEDDDDYLVGISDGDDPTGLIFVNKASGEVWITNYPFVAEKYDQMRPVAL